MTAPISLQDYTEALAAAEPGKAALGRVVLAIGEAAVAIAERVSMGSLLGSLDVATGTENSDGDVQKALDLFCEERLREALAHAPVSELASEEAEEITTLDPFAPLAVAFDPLDGSGNIDTNITIGTIFSVVPTGRPGKPELRSFGGPGSRQVAAGFTVYGPQTMLVLTHGNGVDLFILDRAARTFRLARTGVTIKSGTREYAINASNYRHWEAPVRTYVDDCTQGASGVRGSDFNMRWMGCLVADAFRILMRGGLYLYPADQRPAYRNGRLRLIYEGHPMAMVMEQAGGRASTGRERILDLSASTLHQRTPLIFGSADKVARIEGLHLHPDTGTETSPLFARRGLFR